ncbi:MAG: hypothetical protein ACFFD2_08015 [Promethearchaeota archaeon]
MTDKSVFNTKGIMASIAAYWSIVQQGYSEFLLTDNISQIFEKFYDA